MPGVVDATTGAFERTNVDDDDDDATTTTSSARWDDDDDDDAEASDARVGEGRRRTSSDGASTSRRRRIRSRDAGDARDGENSREALKLLYMVSLYTGHGGGRGGGDARGEGRTVWMRTLPILVFTYEGVVSSGERRCFEYDYAPVFERVYGTTPRYMNITEDGRNDLDNLLERGFLTALKVTSETYDHSTLLKISEQGADFLQRCVASGALSPGDRRGIELLCGYPNLLDVRFDQETKSFYLHDPSPHSKTPALRSTITDVEDVPYVSSPYIPRSYLSNEAFAPNPEKGYRKARRVLKLEGMSLAEQQERAIRDARLDEQILLNEVRVLFTEYVPMGSNEMVAFCSTLGTSERLSGGLFCGESRIRAHFDMVVGVDAAKLTKIKVLDADDVRYANVEADLLATAMSTDKDKAHQIENFGINFRENGIVTYGLVVNGIANRIRDNISVDLLARVLSDAHEDTSLVVENLFSNRQRAMLNTIFKGAPSTRDKFVCIMAERANPKLKAAAYMDGEALENELKQVIGATYFAHDLNEQEVVIFGTRGVLIFGPRTERHHKLLSLYSDLQARSVFIKSVYASCFAASDELKKTRKLIDNYLDDPMNVMRIRSRISNHMNKLTLLDAVQKFLVESVEAVEEISRERLSDLSDDASQTLFDVLTLSDSQRRLLRRAVDLEKIIAACWNDLESLQEMTHVIGSRRKLRVNEAIEGTTRNLEDAFRAQARNSTTLELTQVILSGTLAFDILDRFSGQYLSYVDIRWAVESIQPYAVNVPMIWFVLNMCAWAVVGGSILWLMRHLAFKHCSVETSKITLNKPIHLSRWRRFIASRDVESTTSTQSGKQRVVKYGWTEPRDKKWRGLSPKFEVAVDERYGFILHAFVVVNKRLCETSANDAWRRLWFDVFLAREIFDARREKFDVITGDRMSPAADEENDDDIVHRSRPGASARAGSRVRASARRPSAADDDAFEHFRRPREEVTFDDFVAERARSMHPSHSSHHHR